MRERETNIEIFFVSKIGCGIEKMCNRLFKIEMRNFKQNLSVKPLNFLGFEYLNRDNIGKLKKKMISHGKSNHNAYIYVYLNSIIMLMSFRCEMV